MMPHASNALVTRAVPVGWASVIAGRCVPIAEDVICPFGRVAWLELTFQNASEGARRQSAHALYAVRRDRVLPQGFPLRTEIAYPTAPTAMRENVAAMTGAPVYFVLSREECAEILARNHVGRLAFRAGKQLNIQPLGYVARDNVVFLRSAPGDK